MEYKEKVQTFAGIAFCISMMVLEPLILKHPNQYDFVFTQSWQQSSISTIYFRNGDIGKETENKQSPSMGLFLTWLLIFFVFSYNYRTTTKDN